MFLKEVELERFLAKVEINEENGCWEWTGSHDSCGYGQIKIRRIRPSALGSHRVSYLHYNGDIPEEFCVCHKCDNPKCVNPEHLFVGTNLDNTRDMINKGRDRSGDHKGEANAYSKLKEKDVLEIVNSLSTMNNKQIAEIYDTTHANISLIRRGKSWTHVTGFDRETNEKYQSLK